MQNPVTSKKFLCMSKILQGENRHLIVQVNTFSIRKISDLPFLHAFAIRYVSAILWEWHSPLNTFEMYIKVPEYLITI